MKCGRFYLVLVKIIEDCLLYYFRFFFCVECDMSNYVIFSLMRVEKWFKCVLMGFKFYFKVFGLFIRKVRVIIEVIVISCWI